MDNGTGIVPVMNMGNNADDFGGGGFWIFALLILAMLGNGGLGWGGNGFANAIGYENLATSNEVQRGFDNQNLQAQTGEKISLSRALSPACPVFHVLWDDRSEMPECGPAR